MRITEEGALFFDDAQRILGITERAKKRFENSDKSVLRVLSLGLYSHAELFFLPPALRRLSELYPDLHPRLRVVPFRHIYRLLDEGDAAEVSFGICYKTVRGNAPLKSLISIMKESCSG